MIEQKEPGHRRVVEKMARAQTMDELLRHLDDSKVAAIASVRSGPSKSNRRAKYRTS